MQWLESEGGDPLGMSRELLTQCLACLGVPKTDLTVVASCGKDFLPGVPLDAKYPAFVTRESPLL